MGLLFALLLIGLPLAAAYIDMLQARGVTKLGGFDLPSTGGYTPKWDRTAAASPPSTPPPAPRPAASSARQTETPSPKPAPSMAATAPPPGGLAPKTPDPASLPPETSGSKPDTRAQDAHERPDLPSSG